MREANSSNSYGATRFGRPCSQGGRLRDVGVAACSISAPRGQPQGGLSDDRDRRTGERLERVRKFGDVGFQSRNELRAKRGSGRPHRRSPTEAEARRVALASTVHKDPGAIEMLPVALDTPVRSAHDFVQLALQTREPTMKRAPTT